MKSRLTVPASAFIVLCTVFSAASPASASGLSYDRTDPAMTGCAGSSLSIATYPLLNYFDGTPMGSMEVRYSSSCKTNWVRVNNYEYGMSATKYIERDAGSGLPRAQDLTNDKATGWSYGMQLYGPGCIHVQGMILTSTGNMIAETDYILLC